MQEELYITIVQANLQWKNKEANLIHFSSLLKTVKYTDIIFLPEMFNTAFCPKEIMLAETMNGKCIKWMKKISKEKKCAIAGSLMIKEKNKIYNRFVFINEKSDIYYYDKKHLFALSAENKYIEAGTKSSILIYKGWKIFPQICYDLRFPVFSRNTSNYDLLVYLANWPEKRIDAWDTLLKARSIENQSYTIGVNRVGKDGNGFYFPGHSIVLSPAGSVIAKTKNNSEQVITKVLSKNQQIKLREKLPFLLDQDLFNLN